MHYALISVAINNLAKGDWENIVGPRMLASNVAQGGTELAAATKTKDKKLKALRISAMIGGAWVDYFRNIKCSLFSTSFAWFIVITKFYWK